MNTMPVLLLPSSPVASSALLAVKQTIERYRIQRIKKLDGKYSERVQLSAKAYQISQHTSAANSTNACGQLDTRGITQNSLKLVLT